MFCDASVGNHNNIYICCNDNRRIRNCLRSIDVLFSVLGHSHERSTVQFRKSLFLL